MDTLFSKRFVVVGGKGGVGRTTVAAALAMLLVRRGRRVLLAQTHAKERLSTLLGGEPTGDTVSRVRDNLFTVNMTPAASLREYALMVLRYESLYKAVFENRVVSYFLRAVPGIDEFSMLGKAWFHTTEELEAGTPKYDTVILDGPATGHLVAMLRLPYAILDAVPEGPLTRDARAIKDLITDPARSAMVLVTLAEELPASETVDLYHIVKKQIHMPMARLVVNQLWPERFSRDGAATRALDALEPVRDTDSVLAPLLTRAVTTRRRRALNEQYLTRLGEAVALPQARLPYLFATDFGVAETEMLSRLLEEELTAAR